MSGLDSVLFLRMGGGSTTVRMSQLFLDRIRSEAADADVPINTYVIGRIWDEARPHLSEPERKQPPSLAGVREAASRSRRSFSSLCRDALAGAP